MRLLYKRIKTYAIVIKNNNCKIYYVKKKQSHHIIYDNFV